MAIHDDIPGLEVVLCMPGTDILEESELENEPHPLLGIQSLAAADIQYQRTVTRQVEGEPGEIFSIRITLEPDFVFDGRVLVFVVSVDGQTIGQHPHLSREYFMSCIANEISCAHLFMAPEFRFSHAERSILSSQPSGSIVVRVYHKRTFDGIRKRNQGSKGSISPQKFLQGGNCRSALSSPLSDCASGGGNEPIELIDDSGIPHAIFHFKYSRTTSMLTLTGLEDLTASQTKRVMKLLADNRGCADCGKSEAKNDIEHTRPDAPAKRRNSEDSELCSPTKKIQTRANTPEVDSEKMRRTPSDS
ncbi:hypothetical protein MBM_03500 [Drepanopeziza brunnea f. sp. 'multigermtubi' MB_m1]|uniref:DUF7918 domain-containing protein n=1 Tax=Marssonina brunnea f. sp. multigermtubi (strain MB_m1) TaxID=1072389 RepID=K1X0J4_MARBU|nr:uncharacterized protein MBM_03500 [Drepanopeziza brunnea f. sp. 'multigermtubi' MB_m1]EKD18507.1 hypothetical protein MBM_03500 [Drepanopeziza brunnea f. sp. 'multigermtubi' MB_m1]